MNKYQQKRWAKPETSKALEGPAMTQELPTNDIKSVSDMKNSMKVIDRTQRYTEVRCDKLDEYIYELAAFREAKRTNNEPVPQWLRLELAEVGVYFDHDGVPYNRNANELSARLGESSAALIGARAEATKAAEELARVRAESTKWAAKQAVHLYGIGLRIDDDAPKDRAWHNNRAEKAEAELARAREELSYTKVGAMCPVCLGDPITGKVCICGGSNDAHDAYTNCLRDSLEVEGDLRAELAKERERRAITEGMGASGPALLQELRQVVKEYEADHGCELYEGHGGCRNCIRARRLLANPAPADTQEGK